MWQNRAWRGRDFPKRVSSILILRYMCRITSLPATHRVRKARAQNPYSCVIAQKQKWQHAQSLCTKASLSHLSSYRCSATWMSQIHLNPQDTTLGLKTFRTHEACLPVVLLSMFLKASYFPWLLAVALRVCAVVIARSRSRKACTWKWVGAENATMTNVCCQLP